MGVYQQIKEKFIMKNAREDWIGYRDQLTDLIIKRMSETSSRSVAVVGAGRCCDIDLGRIVLKADKTFLLDIDRDAMQEAVGSLPSELRKKAEPKTISLTGIEEKDLSFFCDDMITFVRMHGRTLSLDLVRKKLMSGLDVLEDKLVRKEEDLLGILPEASADMILCSGVCSQLFSVLSFFIRSLIHSLPELLPEAAVLEEEANVRIREMDEQVILVIDRALCKAARRVVIFGNEFLPKHPVEGAHQCIWDIRNRLLPEEIHLTWDFNPAEGISYDMLLQICNVYDK